MIKLRRIFTVRWLVLRVDVSGEKKHAEIRVGDLVVAPLNMAARVGSFPIRIPGM
jgi:hypothetical protein